MNGLALRPPRRSASLCSGGGGLDLGLRDACGVEPVVYVERDSYAAACLVARMEEASVAPAPIWDDLGTFDGRPWRGVVDIVAGGTPCQDLSVAGKRAGLDGERSGLFWAFCRIIREAQPSWVFWENVAGATSALPRVLSAFEELGYVGAWSVVRASDVGAPHGRARIFVLAHTTRLGREQWWPEPARQPRGPHAAERCSTVADANSVRELQPGWHECDQRGRAGDSRPGVWPPARDDASGWARVLATRPDLAPALPSVRRVAHGLSGRMGAPLRADQLRLLGNGVVPAQACRAWHLLYPAVASAVRRALNSDLRSGAK